MKKLIKVRANKNEFMEGSTEQFCTKGREYPIIDWSATLFAIMDDKNDHHWFDYDEEYFDYIYEGDPSLSNQITVDKELWDTLRCLTISLMDEYCPNKEYILTKEQRRKLVNQFSINVDREVLDNLDERYYII